MSTESDRVQFIRFYTLDHLLAFIRFSDVEECHRDPLDVLVPKDAIAFRFVSFRRADNAFVDGRLDSVLYVVRGRFVHYSQLDEKVSNIVVLHVVFSGLKQALIVDERIFTNLPADAVLLSR